MDKLILARRPLRLPDFGEFSPELSAGLARSTRALRGLPRLAPTVVSQASDAVFAPLKHPLSEAYVERHGQGVVPARSATEREGLARLGSRGPVLDTTDDETFRAGLAALNASCVENGGWRAGHVGTVRDSTGHQIVFPSPDQVPRQLTRLRRLIIDDRRRPALFDAAMALAILTNCHPFRDGNGRVSRMVFNHLLHKGGMSRSVYVPFAELAARSEGGYLITLRQGELRGRWESFLAFTIALLDVHRRLAALAAERT